MSKPSIAYKWRAEATPEAEASALAACYRIILDSANKRGRLLDKGDLDDAKDERSKDDSSAKTRIP